METNHRDLFSFDSSITYFNHAATGMLPARSADAMTQFIHQLKLSGEPPFDELLQRYDNFRHQAARLLNVAENEIAFIKNTTDGLEIALHSIDWQPGDNMVVQEDAFPASLYLAAYCFPHVEKRYVPLQNSDDFYARLERKIDGHTRALVVDYVHFLSGYRMDLHRLGEIARKRNAWLIVDGIQALGAVKLDLKQTPVDFFAAGGMKWLQGPAGTGILYIRPEIMDKMVPFKIGWFSAEYEDLSSLYPVRPLKNHAGRFQPANENYIGLVGLTESLTILNELGPQNTESKILDLTAWTMQQLQKRGCEILTPRIDSLRAGIVSFKSHRVSSEKLYQLLENEKIICSLREGWVRIAIHFYNEKPEIEKVLQIIDSNH